MTADRWSSGDAYESYVGRWSRLVATEFVAWLGVPAGARWADVGCGTGALAETVLRDAAPRPWSVWTRRRRSSPARGSRCPMTGRRSS